MSKIAEKKAKEIAKKLEASKAYKFDNFSVVCGAIESYDQAFQDFFEKAEKWIRYERSDKAVANLMFNSFKKYLQDDTEI